MVMESAPAAAFIVIQPDFVLEFLKIPLDAPADFDQPDQLRELHRPGHGREPVTGWFGFSAGPLNQQQFRYSWFHSQIVAMGHADHEQRETGLHCPLVWRIADSDEISNSPHTGTPSAAPSARPQGFVSRPSIRPSTPRRSNRWWPIGSASWPVKAHSAVGNSCK